MKRPWEDQCGGFFLHLPGVLYNRHSPTYGENLLVRGCGQIPCLQSFFQSFYVFLSLDGCLVLAATKILE